MWSAARPRRAAGRLCRRGSYRRPMDGDDPGDAGCLPALLRPPRLRRRVPGEGTDEAAALLRFSAGGEAAPSAAVPDRAEARARRTRRLHAQFGLAEARGNGQLEQMEGMDGSYLDLLTTNNVDSNQFWLETQFESQQEEEEYDEEVNVVHETQPTKLMKKRTKNFSEQEDVLLVSAWLEISMDAVQGNEQSRKCEQVQQACDLYKAKDKNGKSFGLLHCWNILQHEQKWIERCSQKKKQKTCSNASPGMSTPGTSESRHEEGREGLLSGPMEKEQRPPGKKGEKERLRRGKSSISESENLYMDALENMWAKRKETEELKELKKTERNDVRIAIEQKKLELQEKELELRKKEQEHKTNDEKLDLEKKRLELQEKELELRNKEQDGKTNDKKLDLEKKRLELQEKDYVLREKEQENKVMSMDLAAMSEVQQQYYMKLQQEILAQRFGSGSS
ncbi:hypothetical protein ACP70R_001409 [Stipagrostis hirtigluma subsp. patula]